MLRSLRLFICRHAGLLAPAGLAAFGSTAALLMIVAEACYCRRAGRETSMQLEALERGVRFYKSNASRKKVSGSRARKIVLGNLAVDPESACD